jgi:hypothetical protein
VWTKLTTAISTLQQHADCVSYKQICHNLVRAFKQCAVLGAGKAIRTAQVSRPVGASGTSTHVAVDILGDQAALGERDNHGKINWRLRYEWIQAQGDALVTSLAGQVRQEQPPASLHPVYAHGQSAASGTTSATAMLVDSPGAAHPAGQLLRTQPPSLDDCKTWFGSSTRRCLACGWAAGLPGQPHDNWGACPARRAHFPSWKPDMDQLRASRKEQQRTTPHTGDRDRGRSRTPVREQDVRERSRSRERTWDTRPRGDRSQERAEASRSPGPPRRDYRPATPHPSGSGNEQPRLG